MDLQAMMAQAQQLQQKMAEAQESARQKTVDAAVGGGMVAGRGVLAGGAVPVATAAKLSGFAQNQGVSRKGAKAQRSHNTGGHG